MSRHRNKAPQHPGDPSSADNPNHQPHEDHHPMGLPLHQNGNKSPSSWMTGVATRSLITVWGIFAGAGSILLCWMFISFTSSVPEQQVAAPRRSQDDSAGDQSAIAAAAVATDPPVSRRGGHPSPPSLPMSCEYVSETVVAHPPRDDNNPQQKILVHDKNFFVALTTTDPSFWISLHNETYDPYRWSIMTSGTYYETDLTKTAQSEFRKQQQQSLLTSNNKKGGTSNSIVLDVGANIGWLSLLAASMGQHVVSFEPNPANVFRLCQSILLNPAFDDRIDIYPVGISDEPGELTLSWSSNPGAANFRHEAGDIFWSQPQPNMVTAPITTLDTIAEQAGWIDHQHGTVSKSITTISLLKIDVEGLEPNVIGGAAKLLSSGLVQSIFLEMSPIITGHSLLLDMISSLVRRGYRLEHFFRVAENLGADQFEVPEYDKNDSDPAATTIFAQKVIDICDAMPGQHCDLLWRLHR